MIWFAPNGNFMNTNRLRAKTQMNMNPKLPIDPDEDERLDDLPKPIIIALIFIGAVIYTAIGILFSKLN